MPIIRSEEHTSELQSHDNLVCRLLLEKKKSRNDEAHHRACAARAHCAQRRRLHASRPSTTPLSSPRVTTEYDTATSVMSFFFNDTPTPEIYPLSLHDALPICRGGRARSFVPAARARHREGEHTCEKRQ